MMTTEQARRVLMLNRARDGWADFEKQCSRSDGEQSRRAFSMEVGTMGFDLGDEIVESVDAEIVVDVQTGRRIAEAAKAILNEELTFLECGCDPGAEPTEGAQPSAAAAVREVGELEHIASKLAGTLQDYVAAAMEVKSDPNTLAVTQDFRRAARNLENMIREYTLAVMIHVRRL